MRQPREKYQLRPSPKETWLILGSRHALSWPLFALYLIPVALSIVLLVGEAVGPSTWLQWLVLGVVAWAAPVFVLVIFRMTLLPVSRPRPSRPGLTLLAFVVASLVRAVAFTVTEQALGVRDPEVLWLRLTGGTLTVTVIFGLLAILIAARYEYREDMGRLVADQQELVELQAGLTNRLEKQRTHIVQQAHDVLNPVIESLRSSLAMLPPQETTIDVAHRLRDIVDSVVRPLTVQLSQQSVPIVRSVAGAPVAPNHPRVAPDQRLGLGNFILPFTFGMVVFVMTVSSVLFMVGLTQGIVTLQLMFITLFAMLWIARVGTQRVKLPPRIGGFVYVGIHIVAAVGIIKLLQFTKTNISEELLYGWVFLVAATATLAYRYQLVEYARRLAIQRLLEVNKDLDILTSRLRQQSIVDAKTVANILHGPLQTALYASAMRIADSPNLGESDISRVLTDLDDAMKKLDITEAEVPALVDYVDEMRVVWGSNVTITFVQDSAADTVLARHKTARTCAIEVVREGVNNAIKHAGASHIDIEVFMVEGKLVDVTVRNVANTQSPKSDSGYGSTILDDVTHDWSLNIEENATVLWASIAL